MVLKVQSPISTKVTRWTKTLLWVLKFNVFEAARGKQMPASGGGVLHNPYREVLMKFSVPIGIAYSNE